MITSTQLSIIKVVDLPTPFERKIGDYSFIEIRRDADQASGHPFYWRLKGNRGLIEIGLDGSGALLSIHIPSTSEMIVKQKIHPISAESTFSGLPYFSTSLWKSNQDRYNVSQYYFDEEGEFEIEFENGLLRVSLATDLVTQVVEISGKVNLELNRESNVVSFLMKELKESEIQVINEYIDFQKQKRFYP